jgi:hypothetical protein
MSDEDPIEGGLAIAMTGAASISRAAEVMLRYAQEVKARRAAGLREGVAELRKQIDARGELAAAAMVFYGETGHTEWIKKATAAEIVDAVHASHAWAEIDPERFSDKAQAIREQLAATFGVDLREAYAEKQTADALAAIARDGLKDYDRDPLNPSAYDRHVLAQRADGARTEAMKAAGATEAAVTARAVSDQLNGHDPRGTAAAAAGGRTKAPTKVARRSPARQAGQQRGR